AVNFMGAGTAAHDAFKLGSPDERVGTLGKVRADNLLHVRAGERVVWLERDSDGRTCGARWSLRTRWAGGTGRTRRAGRSSRSSGARRSGCSGGSGIALVAHAALGGKDHPVRARRRAALAREERD